MKKNLIILLCSLPLLSISTLYGQNKKSGKEAFIVVDDFELGNFKSWKVEGEAFGNSPVTKGNSGIRDVSGYLGNYFVSSLSEGDDSRGTLTSSPFKIKSNYINFLIGGGTSPDLYIELVIDGKTIYKNSPFSEGNQLEWMTWDVSKYLGKQAYLRIVDNDRGKWGHILIDQIEMGNIPKSDYMVDKRLSIKSDKKYIMLPIEDKAPEVKVFLEIDGIKQIPHSNIRLAQNKIDYWVPLNIEGYKGKDINLLLPIFKRNGIGYSKINTSNTFNFKYDEPFRPLYHYSPFYGWTNDPNGMVYKDGEYHLFYQYNPYGSVWGNMTWGHAVSKDLINWEHKTPGILPDSEGTIFSGSAVIDKYNTAGFGKDAMVAIYTNDGDRQTQNLAYSLDNGKTFIKYKGNPVLTDPNIVDFRDPKVFWDDDSKQWIMSLATTQTITFYGSKNLKNWEKLSEFGEGIGAHGGVWECPDLFPLTYNGKTKWVLLVSINPGGPNSGSATQYFIGDFDGKKFTPDPLPYPLWIDNGRDNYAGVTWNNEPNGKTIFIGWMSNWDYANQVPSVNFKNAMTLPRELKLVNNGKHLVLANPPIETVKELRKETKTYENVSVNDTYIIKNLLSGNEGAYEIEMDIKPEESNEFSFILSNNNNQQVSFIFDLNKEELSLDRTQSGDTDFAINFSSVIHSPIVKRNIYKIRLLVDKASIELFLNDGETAVTSLIFPKEAYNNLTFKSLDKQPIQFNNINIYKLGL